MNESRDPGMQTATRLVSKGDQLTVLQVPRTRLVVLEGNQADEPYEVPAHGVLVGADPDCDLVLADLAVSRRHLTLTPCEQGIRLRDLNSKNGTRVSGVRVVEALLAGGEEIQLGNTRLQLQVVAGGRDEFPISSHTAFGSLLGRSPAMRRVFALLERAADSESTLLLEGESGTGKDLVAENTHRISPRKDGPFIVVDAGSMQANLAESELFGHRKGAFTGAESDRVGAFEAGGGGTVFIDEVGELPPELQPKLLRLLEKREVKRLGENHYRPVDVRLIAATNRNLKTEVAAGRFREDLFYRLSVVQVRIPPLRDRKEDIGMLARHFVTTLRPRQDPDEIVSDAVLAMLINHDWPGNVRELRNVVERLLLFPDRPDTALAQAGLASETDDLSRLDFNEARRRWQERFESIYLANLLQSCGGVVSKAAERAGISRQTLHRLINKLGIDK